MRTGTTGKRDRKHGNTVGTRAGSCKRDSGRVPQALPCTRGLRVAPFSVAAAVPGGRGRQRAARKVASVVPSRKCRPQRARRTPSRFPALFFAPELTAQSTVPPPFPPSVCLSVHTRSHRTRADTSSHITTTTRASRPALMSAESDTSTRPRARQGAGRRGRRPRLAVASRRVASPAAREGPAAVRGDVLQLWEREGEGSHNPRSASPSPPLKMAQEGGACHMGGVAAASRSPSAARGPAPGRRALGRDWPARRGPRAAPRRHHFLLWAAASGRCLVTMGEIMAA